MNADTLRALSVHLIAVLVLVGGFYGLVIYPYELDQLVKGALISFMGAAIAFVFGSDIAKTTAASTTKALNTPVPRSQEN